MNYFSSIDGLASFGDYSPLAASTVGELVTVAGQFGTDADGQLPDSTPAGQIERAFENVGTALGAAGLTHRDVIKYTTYLVGRETIESFMSVRRKVFSRYYTSRDEYPPNTLLLVAGLVEARFVVEIEALAVKR